MKATMIFKANITTKETYPHCFEIKFCRDVEDSEDIFKEANQFVDVILTGQHLASMTIECLGFTNIREAKMWEMCELERQGIERYEVH